MAFINVNRTLNDQFYRYKMPKLIAKVEGKGNGIKTVIVNMTDIAKALGRPPTYPTKYFGCELGSQTQFDAKKDRYIVNGQHEATKLQDILDGFIKKYVLCAACDNPETVLTVHQKRGVITTACKACGHTDKLETNHKLNTFILKNPPEGNNIKGKDAKTPKKDKKKKDDSPNNSAEENDGNNRKEEFDEVFGCDYDDDGDWIEDTSSEAMTRRMQGLTAAAKNLMVDADTDKCESERVDIFYKFVKDRLPLTKPSQYKEVLGEANRLEIRDKATMVLCELILEADAVRMIKIYSQLFLLFCHENQRAQKYLLGGIEQTIKLHKDVLLAKTALILKTLYDEDIIDEEQLLEWAKKVSKRYVGKEFAQQIHEKAKPFITWLKNAEEESDDDDEDSEDAVEIEYDDRHTAEGLREVKETTPKPNGVSNGTAASTQQNAEDDDDDDLDIDDI